jgi:hypothetical protein
MSAFASLTINIELRFSFLKFASSHQSSMVANFEPEEIHGLDTSFRSESLLAARWFEFIHVHI